MFWQLVQMYPGSFLATVAVPIVVGFLAVIGGVIGSYAGYENLKHQFDEDERARRIEQSVNEIQANKTDLQATLTILKSFNERLQAAGKRDEILVALIGQYQQQSRAAELFGQMTRTDASQEQGKIAKEILNILNEDVVHTSVRNDLPGRPLIIELAPNLFRVIFAVPMRVPPELTFRGLPEGVTPSVTAKSEISFTVNFWPPSIPIHNFDFIASADL